MPIKRIQIVHFSHFDVGFTDQPSLCRELHRRYIDIALDEIEATARRAKAERFYWTAESQLPVMDWWEVASPARRKRFLQAITDGQMEVAALPFNQTPFLDADQWKIMTKWLPPTLWRQLHPRVAMQNDVNGFPRAGAVALLDRGVRQLFMCMNACGGGPPFFRPSAFWWKVPDGRRLFVWMNNTYPDGYDYFHADHWRRGPVPFAADGLYRPPREGDFFLTDEASLREAHLQCTKKIQQLTGSAATGPGEVKRAGQGLERKGLGNYPHDVLTITVTNHWRMDNDPPFLALPKFVAAWNKLGLQPELVLTTAGPAMDEMQRCIGGAIPEHEGEFPDWWANGTAGAPRELAASRKAKSLLKQTESKALGPLPPSAADRILALRKDLCLFDEHTWGSSWSMGLPWSADTQGQFCEKASLAYHALSQAEWLLSQRIRTHLLPEGEGLYVANLSSEPFSGWITLTATALRGNYRSVTDKSSGESMPLLPYPGIRAWTAPKDESEVTLANRALTYPDNAPAQQYRFWIKNLAPNSFKKLALETASCRVRVAQLKGHKIAVDASGWPVSIQWPNTPAPLFSGELGHICSLSMDALSSRWSYDSLSDPDFSSSPAGKALRRKIRQSSARPTGKAEMVDAGPTLTFNQWLSHPSLEFGQRSVEFWKNEPRARVSIRLHRKSSAIPQILYAAFQFPCAKVLPQLSSGGSPFTPYTEQIPGSCTDFFAIDGWADYADAEGHWFWASRDAALVALGQPQIWNRASTAPKNPERLLAMLYNNFWFTNFLADQPGLLEFQFDIVWRPAINRPSELSHALSAQPALLLNQGLPEHPTVMKHLFNP